MDVHQREGGHEIVGWWVMSQSIRHGIAQVSGAGFWYRVDLYLRAEPTAAGTDAHALSAQGKPHAGHAVFEFSSSHQSALDLSALDCPSSASWAALAASPPLPGSRERSQSSQAKGELSGSGPSNSCRSALPQST